MLKTLRKNFRYRGELDYTVVFLVIFLVGFGLVMVYSASSYKGSMLYNDPAYWMKRQALFGGIGIAAMAVIARFDYHAFRSREIFSFLIYFGMIFLLLFTLVFASVSHGSKRWLALGPISFQPSELAKMVLILILASYIHTYIYQVNKNVMGVIRGFGLAFPLILVVGIENLSTCLILMAITMIMLFVVSPSLKPFFALMIAGVSMAAILVAVQPYRLQRILAWRNPEASENGAQTMQGLYAIGSGGLFGKGLGQSIQKMGFVPESHNDMIFSIICEELGFFGALCVIGLFFVLLWRFLLIAMNAREMYGSMIVIGVIAHIGIQVFVNIGVVTNTIPNTGVPLPFISYGGSSLIFLLMEMGLVLSVSRQVVRK